MNRLFLLLNLAFVFGVTHSHAQPFTKKYIMSFHSCDVNQCNGPQDHTVQLAESDDGSNWTLVPNFPSYGGSVPDVIIRNNKLYIYTPGEVTRYDYNTNTWDSSPASVSIKDSAANQVNFVDPSAIVDSSGNLVLIFMNSTGLTGDPAQCATYPCTKYFDSAIEVSGSDGTQFTKQSGHRYSITLTSGTASDPDVYFDGSKYILYISKGTSTYAYYASSLHGSYQVFPNLSNGLLTNNGGIPCGYYDAITQKYWTYVHASSGNSTEIKQKIHSDFNSSLSGLTTVISGTSTGLGSGYKTESPGFTENTFSATTSMYDVSAVTQAYFHYQTQEKVVNAYHLEKVDKIEIYNLLGVLLRVEKVNASLTLSFNINPLTNGVYMLCFVDKKGLRSSSKLLKW